MVEQVPTFSVLMPVYNAAAHLRAAVDSILLQRFADFELIVIDDASTDGSREIPGTYADGRIRRLHNAVNLGTTGSLNRGLRIARGRYIARMDADDLADPQRLELQGDFLDRNPDYGLVAAGYRMIDKEGRVLGTQCQPMGDVELRWISLLRTAMPHSTVSFRRTAPAGEPIFYDENRYAAQDADLWLRLLERSKGCVLDRVLLDYRLHDASIGSRIPERQRADLQDICTAFACRRFALAPEALDWVRDLWAICNRNDPFTDRQFANAVRGLRLLAEHFIAVNALGDAQAGYIRSRAAGQLWNAVLTRQRVPALRLLRLLFTGRETIWPLLGRIRDRHRPMPLPVPAPHTRKEA